MIWLTIYFAIGALFGAFAWFTAGRDVPHNPRVPKHVTLLCIMTFWPAALAAFFFLIRHGDDA